jgi:hypothetical protein
MLLVLAPASLMANGILGPVNPGVIRPGFTTNVWGPNDDCTYPDLGECYNGSPGAIAEPLGFTADFFGLTFDTAYINNNGNITFDSPLNIYTPFDLTSTDRQIIAPLFSDVDTRLAGGQVTWGTTTISGFAAFGVNWLDVDYYNSDPSHVNRNSFQLVLISRPDTGNNNFDIEFNYAGVEWESGQASGGDANGRGGGCARAGYSNGTGLPGTFYEVAGSGVCGSFLDGTGVPDPPSGGLPGMSDGGIPGRFTFQARDGQITPGPSTVPEPATLILLGSGLLGVGQAIRRMRRLP